MRRGDIIAALALLAVAGALLGAKLLLPPASSLLISSQEKQWEYALNVNFREGFHEVINGVVIEIRNNRARVVDSPCRDKLCVRTGWLERSGDMAVCLPQQVTVQVRGAGRGVDGVAG